MLAAFQQHIDKHFPELKQKAFLIACSGGMDSVVLVHLAAQSKLQFAIAHCNFKLRGATSDADAVFVAKLAKELNSEFHITSFDTANYVNKNKVSIQMAARDLRYAWFTQLQEEYGYGAVLTAHHANDALETFIINLSRGTGIAGLTGIPEKRADILRPLLPFSSEQILAYAQNNALKWREDESNSELKYLRNKVRHQIVPVLEELHPTFLNNFLQTQSHLQHTKALAVQQLARTKEALFYYHKTHIEIKVSDLLALNPLQAHLYGLFQEYGFTAWPDLERLLHGMSGKEIRSKTHSLSRNRDVLLLAPINPTKDEVYWINATDRRIDAPVRLEIRTVNALEERANHILYVDKETLKYPLGVRKWRKGDYFYPYGMKGKKKLAKFFKDEKLSRLAKEQQWLLYSGDDLLWVMGRRMDERFKVTKTTKEILKFILIP